MTKGQRAIFAFMIIYFHNVIGWNLFLYGFVSDIEKGLFEDIRSGLEYIGNTQLLEIVSRVETRYREIGRIDPADNRFEDIDIEYASVTDASVNNTVRYIKNNADEFFIFESGEAAV